MSVLRAAKEYQEGRYKPFPKTLIIAKNRGTVGKKIRKNL